MKSRKVLVLNLGWEQLPLVRELAKKERGLELYGVHAVRNTPAKRVLRDLLVADPRDLARIMEFADRIRPDAVLSDACDYSYFSQAVLAARYGLPGPRLEAAQRATNKFLQREAASAAGLRVPEFRLCLSPAEVEAFAERTGWPIILKPADNRGSIGVRRVDRREEVAEAYALALAHCHSRMVMAERFISGSHLTIDGYCPQGEKPVVLALGENRKRGGVTGVVNESILYPGKLPPVMHDRAARMAVATAEALGYGFGHFHGEFIIEKATGELFLTEMANRGGGVHISGIAVPFVSGADLMRRYADDALGLPPAAGLAIQPGERAALLHFFARKDAYGRRLRDVRGLDKITAEPGVLFCGLFVARGARFGRWENGAGRHGMVIVGGKRGDDLDRRARGIVKRLKIEVEPASAEK